MPCEHVLSARDAGYMFCDFSSPLMSETLRPLWTYPAPIPSSAADLQDFSSYLQHLHYMSLCRNCAKTSGCLTSNVTISRKYIVIYTLLCSYYWCRIGGAVYSNSTNKVNLDFAQYRVFVVPRVPLYIELRSRP